MKLGVVGFLFYVLYYLELLMFWEHTTWVGRRLRKQDTALACICNLLPLRDIEIIKLPFWSMYVGIRPTAGLDTTTIVGRMPTYDYCEHLSLLENSKNTLRPFDKLSAQGEWYLDYSIRGEQPPFPFVVSNHLSHSW